MLNVRVQAAMATNLVFAGDDNGDDNVCYWADVKVYDGIVDP